MKPAIDETINTCHIAPKQNMCPYFTEKRTLPKQSVCKYLLNHNHIIQARMSL